MNTTAQAPAQVSPSRRSRGRRGHPRRQMIIVVDDEDRENEGRPDDRGGEGHAGGDQLHGDARPRPDLPADDRGAARRARSAADGARRTPRSSAPRSACRSKPRASRAPASRRADRAATVLAAIDPQHASVGSRAARAHVPAAARNGGVLVRAGQTEAAVDLARIAGLYPAGVICEIMNDDGTMARVPELDAVREAAQAADDHDRGPDSVPDADRGAGAAASRRRRCRPSTASSASIAFESLHRPRNARGAGQGRDRRRRERAGARALALPDRRRLPLGALRLRPAARRGDDAHRGGGAACCCT